MERLKKVQELLKERHPDVDAVFVVNTPDSNFYYVSGLGNGTFDNCIAIMKDSKVEILVSILEYQMAKRQTKNKVTLVSTGGQIPRLVAKGLRGCRRIGVTKKLPYAYVKMLIRLGKKLVDVSDALEETRLVKDREEIEKIKKACSVSARAFGYVKSKKLKTENDYAAEIEWFLRKNSCDSSFEMIAAGDKNSAIPHYAPGNVKVKNMIMLDFGARYMKYCSDMTRVIILKNKPWIKKFGEVVMDAYNAGIDKLAMGTTGSEFHRVVENVLKKHGFKFVHGAGHFLGVAIHEGSVTTYNRPLVKNMVFTLEPGIYKKGVGGFRYENTILKTRKGFKVLTK